jgi:hypothetical protein
MDTLNALLECLSGARIGRNNDADIKAAAKDTSVSRFHGMLRLDELGNLVYQDNSKFGSYVSAEGEMFWARGGDSVELFPGECDVRAANAQIMFGAQTGPEVEVTVLSAKSGIPVEDSFKVPKYRLDVLISRKE